MKSFRNGAAWKGPSLCPGAACDCKEAGRNPCMHCVHPGLVLSEAVLLEAADLTCWQVQTLCREVVFGRQASVAVFDCCALSMRAMSGPVRARRLAQSAARRALRGAWRARGRKRRGATCRVRMVRHWWGGCQCSRAPFLRLALVPCELVQCLHPCCLGGGEVQRTALGHVRAWQGLAT